MPDGIIILEPGDQQSQKIARAMASPMAGEIIRVIAAGEKTSSDVSQELSIPITTVKYHIENLLDAGLIEISRRRYSVKGREVKIYRLTDRLIIMAPRHTDIRALLARFGGMMLVLLVAAVLLAGLLPAFSQEPADFWTGSQGAAPAVQDNRPVERLATLSPEATPGIAGKGVQIPETLAIPQGTAPPAGPTEASGHLLVILAFLAGGVVVIGAVLAWELTGFIRYRRNGGGARRSGDISPPSDEDGEDEPGK